MSALQLLPYKVWDTVDDAGGDMLTLRAINMIATGRVNGKELRGYQANLEIKLY
jgi:hypothetical protein